MDIIDNIINYFKSEENSDEKKSPEGISPTFWGFQEYDGKIRTILKDKQIDINNHIGSYTVIEDFMKHHIDGIKLKDGIITDSQDFNTLNENNMTIKEIKEALRTAELPVVKSFHQGKDFKILMIGFNKGMILKDHKSNVYAKLTVLEGSVIFKDEDKTLNLNLHEEIEIPIDITHSVEAIEDSLCLLIKSE